MDLRYYIVCTTAQKESSIMWVNMFCTFCSAADISFEQPTYEVSEDIADDNLALRVCFDVAGVSSEMSVTLKTLSTTAQGIP